MSTSPGGPLSHEPHDAARHEPQDVVPHAGGAPAPRAPGGELPLIEPGTGIVPAHPAVPPAPVTAPTSREVARTGGAGAPIVTFFGDVHRSGRWRVPSRLTLVPVFGDAVLDLREALFESPEVEFVVHTAFGDVTVVVLPGTEVQVRGLVVFGDEKIEQLGAPDPARPRVVISAYGAFGDVKVHTLEAGEPIPSFWDRFRRRR